MAERPLQEAPSQADRRRPPSKAYDDARNSLLYRLSELMFGSLLAAYVLGFISFAGLPSSVSAPRWSYDRLMLAIPPLCISLTYAYITAGMYVAYHTQVLTMSHLPMGRLRVDFGLALITAIGFGIAMLEPVLFPATVAMVLFFSTWRQRYETQKHADRFYSEPKDTPFDREPKVGLEHFRESFYDLLAHDDLIKAHKHRNIDSGTRSKRKKQQPLLIVWRRLKWTKYLQAIPLMLLSLGLVVMATNQDASVHHFSRYAVNASALGIFAATWWNVHRTLKASADLLLNLLDMDEEFKVLKSML
jgi:hypothetical protein